MTFPVPGNMSVSRQVRIVELIKIAQVIFTITVFILAIARIATLKRRGSRSDTWIISVSVKSLVVLAYEICTKRIPKFRRFGSLKAYSILNCIETVFWIVAVAMTGMGLGRSSGITKALGAVILILGLALFFLAIPTAYIALSFFFHVRRHGAHPDLNHHSHDASRLRSGTDSDADFEPKTVHPVHQV